MPKKTNRVYKIDGDDLEIQCIKCGQILSSICFSKSCKGLFGLNETCKECCKEKYQLNKKAILQKAKETYKKNKKSKIKYATEYYYSNSENICKQHKEYRENNKDKIKEMRAIRRANNKERINLQNEKYIYKKCVNLGFDWGEFHNKALYYAKYNKLRPQLCYVCGKECTPHLHHISYEGFDKRKDVVFVCDACHKNRLPRKCGFDTIKSSYANNFNKRGFEMNRRKIKKTPSTNEQWKRNIMDVEIEQDVSKKLTMFFYGNIYPKKNSKRAFRGIVLPSENYIKRHKIMSEKLKGYEWKYNSFPCRMIIVSTARSKVRGDIDNQATSLMDLLVDVGLLPDDNKFIIQELEIKNVGYVKNAPICKVELTPIEHHLWDENKDHKNFNLKEYKGYVA